MPDYLLQRCQEKILLVSRMLTFSFTPVMFFIVQTYIWLIHLLRYPI